MKEFNELIEKIGNKEDFFFVQIGSHDGIGGGNDPLYEYVQKHNWHGKLVEPVSYLYEKLKKNYEGCSNLSFINSAVSKDGTTKKFFRVEEHDTSAELHYYDQLGSFDKDVVLSHRNWIPEFDKYFKEEEIETTTFDSLVGGVDYIDLLHIDTEGYDFEIIKSIDFSKHTPSVILFEHTHLHPKKEGLRKRMAEVYKYLDERGYECVSDQYDTLAVRRDLQE